jgi:MoxR-like ATPase
VTDEVAHLVPDIETLAQRLASVDYLVDEGLATSMFLGLRLPQPLLLEGAAGVGKTEAAKALAAVLDTPLVRLQCYEGIDAAEALYEWNYPRQLISIRLADSRDAELREEDLFGPDYLIRRPLLRALEHPGPRPAVLLIDEIDRADDDFEAFLLELLAVGDDPGDRHHHGDAPADHRAYLEPDARPPRRGQAALPVPLDRLPGPPA